MELESSTAPDPIDVAPADHVERALADAITEASREHQWTAVTALVGELQARREARAGVVDLDAERARRGRQ